MLKHMHTLNEFVHYLVKSGVSDPAEVSPLHLAPSRMWTQGWACWAPLHLRQKRWPHLPPLGYISSQQFTPENLFEGYLASDIAHMQQKQSIISWLVTYQATVHLLNSLGTQNAAFL